MKTMLSFIAILLLGAGPLGAVVSAPGDSLAGVRSYPNPWRSDQHSAIPMKFDPLPSTPVTLRIFTISGELVKTLSGSTQLQWDMSNNSGERVASGIYLYLLTDNDNRKTGKIAVIR